MHVVVACTLLGVPRTVPLQVLRATRLVLGSRDPFDHRSHPDDHGDGPIEPGAVRRTSRRFSADGLPPGSWEGSPKGPKHAFGPAKARENTRGLLFVPHPRFRNATLISVCVSSLGSTKPSNYFTMSRRDRHQRRRFFVWMRPGLKWFRCEDRQSFHLLATEKGADERRLATLDVTLVCISIVSRSTVRRKEPSPAKGSRPWSSIRPLGPHHATNTAQSRHLS